MPDPIRTLTLVQFATLLGAARLTRRIVQVHIHHTWRPRRQDFRGLATIEAMRRFHMETNGWSDIAQHLTIDPEGGLWTGRNWNQRPASSSGFNGSDAEGPFMIEMVGDFDEGRDPFVGPQKAAAIEVAARLLQHFELEPDAVRFHRQLGSPKTCPGSGIDYDTFRDEVAEAVRGLATPSRPRGARPFAAEHLAGFAATRAAVSAQQRDSAEVPEHASAGHEIERLSHAATSARQATESRVASPSVARDTACGKPEWNVLKPHAVNMSRGELSEGGEFCSKPEDLDAIIDAIRAYAATTPQPHVVLYAHGGLVNERPALDYARTVLPWWLDHGVFPVFFVWESGLLEILRQFIVGPRDLADFTTDPAIEIAAKIPGSLVWGGMKESARRSSSPDAGNGFAGGALQFARKLGAFVSDAQNPAITVHAVGHSAGAIFHAHLVPRLLELGVTVDTMALLAPAARVDLFKDKLIPLLGNGVKQLSFFTMEEDAERQDDCFKVYRKSLLYLISRSFEGTFRKPIVGLDEHIRRDPDLAALFGLSGGPARAELQFSFAPGQEPNPLTAALRHGDFDNDPKTMGSVLRRVVNVDDATKLGEDDFPLSLTPRSLDELLLPIAAASVPMAPAVLTSPGGPSVTADRRPRALCIGINEYQSRPLAGCVKDARSWGAVLEQLGFAVSYLLDRQATREAMVAAFVHLVSAGSPDVPLVLQYAGHGTQVPDDSGDEVDQFDEAFVPVDYHLGRLLLDDDVAAILSRLPQQASMTLFMDCCHSGTNSRFAPLVGARNTSDERVRFLPPSAELVEAHREFRRTTRALAGGAGAAEDALPGVVHFAACQDNEFAWETAGQGDFTGVASRLLKEAVARGDTNEIFMAAVQRGVAAKARQHPLLMRLAGGRTGLPLFGGRH